MSKAHRRIKIRQEDWGYQACRLRPGRIWLNKVGTYGMAPAAYHWARASGAIMVRLVLYLLGHAGPFEAMLYVDDFLFMSTDKHQVEHIGMVVFFLEALGVPFRWDKFRGGASLPWIGYWFDLHSYQLGMPPKRAAWMRDWLGVRMRDGWVDLPDLEAVLGRLCFALGPLEFARPLLAPIYAWCAAVGRRVRVRVPWFLALLFRFLREQFSEESRTITVMPWGPL